MFDIPVALPRRVRARLTIMWKMIRPPSPPRHRHFIFPDRFWNLLSGYTRYVVHLSVLDFFPLIMFAIYKLYMKSEQKASLLEAEIVKLKTQLADSELRFIAASKKVRSGALKLATDRLGVQDPAQLDTATVTKLIRKLGCHFQVFYSPYLEPEHFSAPRPEFGAYDLERFSVPGNEHLGITADLYECIPPQYHDFLLSPRSNLYSEKYVVAVSDCYKSLFDFLF